MAVQEDRVEQSYTDLEKERKYREISPLKYYSSRTILIVGGAILLMVYLAWMNKWDMRKILAIAGGVLLLVTLAQKKEVKSGYLEEQEAKDILYSKLKRKQVYTSEIPDGEIVIDGYTYERYKEKGFGGPMFPWKRDIGFYIVDRFTGLEHYYVASVNIDKSDRPGDIISIKAKPDRYDGNSSYDIKEVWGKDLERQIRFTREMKGER